MSSENLNISYISAVPRDKEYLGVEAEFEEIQRTIKCNNSIKIEPSFNMNKKKFRHILRVNKIDILHYSGHSDEKGIIFTDKKDGNHDLMSISALKTAIKNNSKGIYFLIINSCKSDTIANNLKDEIPLILSFQKKLDDNQAINFSRSFYNLLCLNPFNLSEFTLFDFYKQLLIILSNHNLRESTVLHFNGIQIPFVFPKIEFKLLDDYKTLYQNINKTGENFLNNKICHFNKGLINNTLKKLEENGIVFIVSPLLSGKSIFIHQIKLFAENNKIHYQVVDPVKIEERHKREIEDTVDFYTLVAHNIIFNAYQYFKPKQNDQNDHIFARLRSYIEDKTKIKTALNNLYSEGERNYLIWLIHWIDSELKTLIDKIAILSVTLEEFHYVKNSLIQDFKLDVESINRKLTNYKVRLIVTSRYIPSAWIPGLTINLVNLTENDIANILFDVISSEIKNKSDIKILAKITYQFTKGHPWYVSAIIKHYINERIKGNTQSPVSLIYEIGINEEIWSKRNEVTNVLYDKILYLWRETDPVVREDALKNIKYLLENPRKTYEGDNSFIIQSGLFEVFPNASRKDINGFTNFIAQNFTIRTIYKSIRKS